MDESPSEIIEKVKSDVSLWAAINVLHGDGFRKFVRVAWEDDTEATVEVGDVNPLTMRIVPWRKYSKPHS